MFELLENRRLLSATFEFDPRLALLTVRGTDKPDSLEMRLQTVGDKQLSTVVELYSQRQLFYKLQLPVEQLMSVNFLAGDGDDVISVYNRSNATVSIYGESGADIIRSSNEYLAPGSNVYGGEGNDVISLFSYKKAAGHLALGGAGDDLIAGGDGADSLWGDLNTKELVKFGDDSIFGGAGGDYIYGGEGNDWLCGEDGDDYIDATFGADFVDGGAGIDFAIVDSFDKITAVEDIAMIGVGGGFLSSSINKPF